MRRKGNPRFKKVVKHVTRGHRRVKMHVYKLKKSAAKK